jgi:hypothetical protein
MHYSPCRPPEKLPVGQASELFSLPLLFEDLRSNRWVTCQHPGGDVIDGPDDLCLVGDDRFGRIMIGAS